MSITTRVFRLPQAILDPVTRAIGFWVQDEITGETDTTFDLSQAPSEGTLLLFKNGALMEWADYSVSDATITLDVAAIAADVFSAQYLPRQR